MCCDRQFIFSMRIEKHIERPAVVPEKSAFKALCEPRQANLCLRAFRHDKL